MAELIPEVRIIVQLKDRIRELEDELRLAEPLLPPNAPWGIVNKVRKALDRREHG